MFGLTAFVVIMALVFGGFYVWARQQGLLGGSEQAAEAAHPPRHISLLAEAFGYVGAILILAGGTAAISQQWHNITGWGRVAVLAGTAVLFFLAGVIARPVQEPAIQRLVDVVWVLSVAGAAGAVGVVTGEVYGNSPAVTGLAAGITIAVYAGALWLARPRALENFAVFAGLIVTVCSVIFTIDASAGSLPFALVLWGLGLAWVGLGWRRYVEPLWVTVPSGVLLALLAPSLAAGEYGWLYAIGIASAAAAMAASVPVHNTPLLALGSLAMFGYLTAVVVRYFHQSMGVPGALAITGVLILGVAAVTARMMRATRPSKPAEPGAAAPSRLAPPPKPRLPRGKKPSHRGHLPRAS